MLATPEELTELLAIELVLPPPPATTTAAVAVVAAGADTPLALLFSVGPELPLEALDETETDARFLVVEAILAF